MKKILFASGHSRMSYKWGMVGEVVKRLMEDPENDIYYLDCNGAVKGPCGLNHRKHWGYCNKCSKPCLKVLAQAGFPEDKILRMEEYEIPEFPDFSTIDEIRAYNYGEYNFGLGPLSCVMTITRDYDFDVKKWQKYIKRFFGTEYVILQNIKHYHEIYKFDEIHTFNGRMASMYPYVSFAKVHNIPYTIYEGGAKIDRLMILHNAVPHEIACIREEIAKDWQNGGEDKIDLAHKFFLDRRGGKFQMIESFTKDQKKDLLPADFDESKENIVYFNSSNDECAAFPGWKIAYAKNENEILTAIFEHYKDDPNKHFYLRVHPNLKGAKKKNTTQIREIAVLKKKYKNLTVIEPEQKIDSYALVEACSKVLSTQSTMGCEATYWGAISISTGNAAYDKLDCVYKAHSMDEIFELIDNKDLTPKPKENTYPFGYYYETFGEKYRYYKLTSRKEGDFLGLVLKSK